MKNLIIVIILGIIGYFAYQYLIGSSQQVSTTAKPTFNMYSLPEKCQREGESLKDAFGRREMGKINKVGLNGYTTNFRRCLRRAGFTDSEIDEAYDGIKDSF